MNISSHLSNIQNIVQSSKNHTIEIDLSEDLASQFKASFELLQRISQPVLYWFETSNIEDAQKLKDLFEVKRPNLKVVPPINGNLSKTLYLGVRQGGQYKREETFSRISGRIYHHFGLYKVESTQGLKLEKWATKTEIKINLNIIEFDLSEKQYLYILEKLYALELKPMFGKH